MPKQILLHRNFPDYDYIDSFEYWIRDEATEISITDISQVFVDPYPRWFEALLGLRNMIVSLFGIKTVVSEGPENHTTEGRWDTGTHAGIFKVYEMNKSEIILGGDDKHLDVRVGLFLEPYSGNENVKHIVMTTLVKYNNSLGRAYFFFVKPFHRTAVPYIMKQKIKALEKEIAG